MRRAVALASAAALAAGAHAQWAGEFLLPPADSGFALGWIAPPAAPTPMREWAPRGESVERWTRLVTVLQLPYRPGLTPTVVAQRLAASFTPACPGASATPIAESALGTHPIATVRVDCPRNPQTGLPETMWARVILGDERLHMVQAAVRRAPTAADERWATGVLAGAALCGSGPRCAAARGAAVGSGL